MSTSFVVGAYASLPEDRHDQEEYYALLAQNDWINGIEIPYPKDLAQDPAWLSKQIPSHWNLNTVTAIPGTMQHMWDDGRVGLASSDEDGRAAALEFAEKVRQGVLELANLQGRKTVSFVQLHSAPTTLATAEAFTSSLETLLSKDWAGAQLVIEHCDALRPDWKPEKGFLELEQEIDIAQSLHLGIHLNWGRSCLEARDEHYPEVQIKQCAQAEVLTGIIFSGAGPEATQYGYEWIDGHLPAQCDEPTSLLTEDLIATSSRSALESKTLQYLGAKICVPKHASLPERLGMIEHIYRATQQAQ